MAVHVVWAAGASVVTGQLTVPTFASATPTACTVTLPVFVRTNVYGRVEPTVFPVGMPACLSRLMLGLATTVVSVESIAETAAPTGGVAETVAVLTTWPESRSAWVSVYVFVHVVCAPGASVVMGQDTAPTLGSSTPTEVSETLPVFVRTKLYRIVEPAVAPLGAPACLSSVMAGPAAIVVFVESVPVTVAPAGEVAETVAVFATCPASMSDCSSVYVAVQVVADPGDRVVTGHETVPTLGSLTVTPVSVTLPVFVTTNEYGSVLPAVAPLGVPACLSSATPGPGVTVESVESCAVIGGPDGGVTVRVALFGTWPASTSDWVSE